MAKKAAKAAKRASRGRRSVAVALDHEFEDNEDDLEDQDEENTSGPGEEDDEFSDPEEVSPDGDGGDGEEGSEDAEEDAETQAGAADWDAIPDFDDLPPAPITTRRGRQAALRSNLRVTNFPTPKAGSKKMNWKELREYWQAVYDTPECRPRLRVFVYRIYPKMVEGHRQVARLEGEPADGSPELLAAPLTVKDVLHRYGAGAYSFRINDAVLPGVLATQARCVLDKSVSSEFLDEEEYPPKLDLDYLDREHPDNGSYIRKRMQRGGFEEGAEEAEMSKVLDILERQNERLERKLEDQSRGGSNDKSELKSLEMMAHAAKASIDMVTQQAAKSGSAGDAQVAMQMMGMFKEMVSMQQAVTAKPATDDPWMKLFMEANQAEKAAIREQMALIRDTMKEVLQASQKKEEKEEPNFVSQMRQLSEMKELMKSLGVFRERPSAGTDWGEVASKFAPLVAPLMGGLQMWLMSMAQKNGQAVPAPMLPSPGGFGGAGQPPMPNVGMTQEPQSHNQSQESGMGGGMGIPPEDLAKLPPTFRTPEGIFQHLEDLRQPLLRFLNDPTESGESFAEWYVGWKDDAHYRTLQDMMPEGIMQVLAMFPPIWGQIESRKDKALKFFGDFVEAFSYDDNEDPDENSDDQEQGYDDSDSDRDEEVREVAHDLAQANLMVARKSRGQEAPKPVSVTAPADKPKKPARPKKTTTTA